MIFIFCAKVFCKESVRSIGNADESEVAGCRKIMLA